MTAKWGFFLCNCRRTLPLDPDKLVLPIVPPVLSFADEPETEIQKFAAAVKSEQPDRILIACCDAPDFFSQALETDATRSPKLEFVNLKDQCFSVHLDVHQAHAKATRLLRAAIETAEVEEAPAYNSLTAGRRILIAAEGANAKRVAERLKDVAQPLLVIPPDDKNVDAELGWSFYKGTITEIRGRLGDFRVTIENAAGAETERSELKSDQVIVISQDESSSYKPRTGCYLLGDPSEDDLEHLVDRVRALTGEFLKPVQVNYNTEVCAGGTANQEACGVCISACPYDAIGRDPENHLRVLVNHMACEGCGACVSACPTTALRFTDPSPRQLYARMAALLTSPARQNGKDALTLLFHCSEQGRRALEEAGRKALPYPATVLPVEVPCLRYVSEANILAAFHLGAAGVGVLGCERCQHGERELLHQKLDFCRLTLDAFGMDSDRLRLITVDNGTEAEAIRILSEFAESLRATPIRWNGQPMQHWGSREVIADALKTFIEQLGTEPGRKSLGASQPFAYAEVKASGCTMCRSCVNVCPTHAFRLDEKTQSLQFKHIACVACELCEKVCPENVIALRQEIHFDRKALEHHTVVQDDMFSCVKCGKPYINRKALDTIEARMLSLSSLLDTFSGSRRNLLRMCPDCRAVVAMMEVDKGWKP